MGSYIPPPWGDNVRKFLTFFCTADVFSIYLFNHLFISAWIHELFILYFGLQSSAMLFIFLLKLFQLWPLGALSGWVYVPLTCLIAFWFWVLLYFLVLQDAPGSSCIFPAPILESAISPRSCDSFYWRMVFRKRSGYIWCDCCYWSVTDSRPFQ